MNEYLIWISIIATGVWCGNVLSFLFADWLEEWQFDREVEEELVALPKKAKKK